jgi:predicted nucleic acid-binding protein
MNLFIDTNVFLSFYHLTSDDLEELRKLTVLIEKGKITLFLPEQIVDEFRRNREIKIADAIKRLKDQKLNLQFPQLCKDYEEYPKLRELQKEYEKHHADLLKRIAEDVDNNSLKADEIIDGLCEKALSIETTDELVSKARLRMDIGNPPGKNGSLGDAINWEALLDNVPDEEDLFLVADDRDYFSSLDENKPKEFLINEWGKIKQSDVTFYRRLSPFFKEHYPDIKLASELEKELLIKSLCGSSNFANTHTVIAKLSKYSDFTTAQANEIAEAALANNQVRWIISDSDVFEFLSALADSHRGKITELTYEALSEKLKNAKPAEEDDNDEISF